MRNALTVDVEDYFHVAAFSADIKPSQWDSYEQRVVGNTDRLLDIFSESDVKATFFVLGWVAQRFPQLIKKIDAGGHEVACHGLTHQLIYSQRPELFKSETLEAKHILEDILQKPVIGYRAASYSITARSIWALDILAEAGFLYDSSIFPIKRNFYGIPASPRSPHEIVTARDTRLVEFPLSTVEFFGRRLPVAGGGYFRLLPYGVTRAAFRRINRSEGRPFIFYLHPWEIDEAQPRINSRWFSRFRHYNNIEKCESRLRMLLKDFKFTSARDVLEDLGWSFESSVPA